MRLTALQLPARFGQAAAQRALAEALLEEGPAGDVVLLPEAALTGYVSPRGDFDLTAFAEPLAGPTVETYARWAARHDCLLVGPLVERAGDACFNALVGVTPGGDVLLHYRKRHPWFPEAWATAGADGAPLVTWRGVRLTAAICFDVHFLTADAAPTLDAAELLLFASAWVDDEADARPGLLSGLVGRHRLAVLNANWGAGAPRLAGQGGSLFLDAQGRTSRLGPGAGRLDVTLQRAP